MSPTAGGGSCRVSANEYSCAHEAQINFGDLTSYLIYGKKSDKAFAIDFTQFFKQLALPVYWKIVSSVTSVAKYLILWKNIGKNETLLFALDTVKQV
jgi:hypothetical protein